MTEAEVHAAAGAIVSSIRQAGRLRGMTEGEIVAAATLALVEIIGSASGPVGLVSFLRDLAAEAESDNRRRVA